MSFTTTDKWDVLFKMDYNKAEFPEISNMLNKLLDSDMNLGPNEGKPLDPHGENQRVGRNEEKVLGVSAYGMEMESNEFFNLEEESTGNAESSSNTKNKGEENDEALLHSSPDKLSPQIDSPLGLKEVPKPLTSTSYVESMPQNQSPLPVPLLPVQQTNVPQDPNPSTSDEGENHKVITNQLADGTFQLPVFVIYNDPVQVISNTAPGHEISCNTLDQSDYKIHLIQNLPGLSTSTQGAPNLITSSEEQLEKFEEKLIQESDESSQNGETVQFHSLDISSEIVLYQDINDGTSTSASAKRKRPKNNNRSLKKKQCMSSKDEQLTVQEKKESEAQRQKNTRLKQFLWNNDMNARDAFHIRKLEQSAKEITVLKKKLIFSQLEVAVKGAEICFPGKQSAINRTKIVFLLNEEEKLRSEIDAKEAEIKSLQLQIANYGFEIEYLTNQVEILLYQNTTTSDQQFGINVQIPSTAFQNTEEGSTISLLALQSTNEEEIISQVEKRIDESAEMDAKICDLNRTIEEMKTRIDSLREKVCKLESQKAKTNAKTVKKN